jgi:hypothetical protein
MTSLDLVLKSPSQSSTSLGFCKSKNIGKKKINQRFNIISVTPDIQFPTLKCRKTDSCPTKSIGSYNVEQQKSILVFHIWLVQSLEFYRVDISHQSNQNQIRRDNRCDSTFQRSQIIDHGNKPLIWRVCQNAEPRPLRAQPQELALPPNVSHPAVRTKLKTSLT